MEERTRSGRGTRGRIAFAILLVAAAAGTAAWLVIAPGGESSSTEHGVSPVGPIALSASGLQRLAGVVGQPIYWAGPSRGHMYELTRTSAGNVYVRYLPRGVKAGAKGDKYLVVATYPYAHALAALRASSGKEFHVTGSRGIAVVDPQHATNVRVAFPGVNYQVEVYDPYPRVARGVATSGVLVPVATS